MPELPKWSEIREFSTFSAQQHLMSGLPAASKTVCLSTRATNRPFGAMNAALVKEAKRFVPSMISLSVVGQERAKGLLVLQFQFIWILQKSNSESNSESTSN
jgi:hypothetical protein